jgi:hypothetical protein
MISKCQCQWCDGNIEFDVSDFTETGASAGKIFGQTVPCPHCQKDTILFVPKAAVTIPPPPVASPSTASLRTCRDCGQPVSVHAEFCPHCGATYKKKHGVFFYVFWGIVSFIATIFILWILVAVFLGVGFVAIPAFMAARHESQIRNGITNSVEATKSPANDLLKQKTDYINDSLKLYDCHADYHDSLIDGRVPGVEFKIKNNGNRTLRKVEVTFYFKDSSGQTISEEKYYPVLVTKFGTDNNPLKPGYIWQVESGHFYAAKKVPSEWQPRNTTTQITDIEFEK